MKYRAIKHSLQLAAQVMLDAVSHIMTADFRSPAQEYRELISALGQVDVLEPEFAQRLTPLASFRNILANDYLEVDPAIIHDLLIKGRADCRNLAGKSRSTCKSNKRGKHTAYTQESPNFRASLSYQTAAGTNSLEKKCCFPNNILY